MTALFDRFFTFFRRSKSSPPRSSQSIDDARMLIDAGRLPQAKALLLHLTEKEPGNVDAHHLLGIVAYQLGDNDLAVTRMTKALSLDPGQSAVHSNLALALLALKRLDEAEVSLRKAISLQPENPLAHNNLGIVLHERGQLAEAEAAFRTALSLAPDNADAFSNLANILRERGDPASAEVLLRRLLETGPNAKACNDLASIVQAQGKADQAEQLYRQAISIEPNYAEAHNNLGTVLLNQARYAEAEDHFRRALELRPDLATALMNLAETHLKQDHLDDAENCYRRALEHEPRSVSAIGGIGEIHLARGDLDEAEKCFRETLLLAPGETSSHLKLGRLFSARGEVSPAENCYREALALAPESATAKYNLSTLALLRGHYEEGWTLYESRFDAFPGRERTQTELSLAPRWRGEGLAGRRIMVWAEQGLGDSIMTMRYLSLLKARGASHVAFCCPPSLIRLALSLPDVDLVLPLDERPDADGFDVHCPIMSLPHLFGTTLDTIPDRMPYLHPQRQLAEQWQQRLTQLPRPRVGLVWAGSKTLRDDAKRSIPLHQFAPLRQIRDIQFISLQKGEEAAQLAASGWEIPDWMDLCGDLMDTAALIDNLDLVISVDTAVVHLAGALAKPVWLLNRFESEWRWGIGKERSPWYPSMRIFNQDKPGNWENVIQHVTTELTRSQPPTTKSSDHQSVSPLM